MHPGRLCTRAASKIIRVFSATPMNHVNPCDSNATVTLEITHQSAIIMYCFRWLLLPFTSAVDMHFIWRIWVRWAEKPLNVITHPIHYYFYWYFIDARFVIESKLEENLINLFISGWHLNFHTAQHMNPWNFIYIFNLCIAKWYFVRHLSRWKALNAFLVGIHSLDVGYQNLQMVLSFKIY